MAFGLETEVPHGTMAILRLVGCKNRLWEITCGTLTSVICCGAAAARIDRGRNVKRPNFVPGWKKSKPQGFRAAGKPACGRFFAI
jgi:hypothetical protein